MEHEDLYLAGGFEQLYSIPILLLLLIKADITDSIQFERTFHDI